MHVYSPASRTEAVDLIQTFRPVPATPGAGLLYQRASLDALFDRGQRAPERVWALSSDEPAESGLVAARLLGDLALVDMLALPVDDTAATALLDAATSWAHTAARAEVSFESPVTDDPLTDPTVARIVGLLGRAGWRLLTTRLHYDLPAATVAGASAALPLSAELERAGSGDRQRLVALLARVLPGSRDARDREEVATHGLAAAAERQADELVESDPIECLHFARAGGEDVGFVSWCTTPSGRGYLAAVGVAVAHRGHGLGGELVAAATRDLVASGADPLIADTDEANIPMVRGFARAGWAATQARIDLVLTDRQH